ncbi:MAG: methyltransferase domain-containing protein [Synechococcales cyanobacterium K44_A2020_017]|nr:methyltransferase domain-containing protein [Synechococcales cyanobacterium K32_A2020_035]MBF2095368.1 methyltransferase domain-containing protein [Synechococcales cyanobacterium K44_A2020_017]
MAELILPELYDPEFFEALREGSRQSAQVIVPLILQWIQPTSVVDVGCGDGSWLSVFQSEGVNDILGMDGDYVQSDTLQIPQDRFIATDLSQPPQLERRFDLALSLEVAEHLSEESADRFVESLVQLSDVILFSAAIPHQGGTHHVNEQWPDYWIQRFQSHNYLVLDILRDRLWEDPTVQPWYAQNSFIFVKGDRLSAYPNLKAIAPAHPKAIVHPTIYLQKCIDSSSPPTDEPPEPWASPILQLLDVTLDPAELHCGDRVTITIHYQLKASLESALFTISLSDASGHIYLDTEIIINPLPTDITVPHTLDLHIERLDLAQGTYFINPGIFSPDWEATYVFQWHQYPLEIQSSPSQKGLLHPPLHWSSDQTLPMDSL